MPEWKNVVKFWQKDAPHAVADSEPSTGHVPAPISAPTMAVVPVSALSPTTDVVAAPTRTRTAIAPSEAHKQNAAPADEDAFGIKLLVEGESPTIE